MITDYRRVMALVPKVDLSTSDDGDHTQLAHAVDEALTRGGFLQVVGHGIPQATIDDMLHVLYLVFNEDYAGTSGPELVRSDLSAEAIRPARIVHRLSPDDSEVTGLLSLMLLTDARRPARMGPDGAAREW
ncbi:putative ECF subfamily RNA polymerase sigma-24 factor [Amycolatopsis decaplanina DSM 44594]|uniref:Putative ECF subfamily RNA polymerase sigma-24 factor n=1 Tax=Amycolatopsis decaplanina DSM 44594 TaxID=1284240 RepID=M2YS40_9PSEU|nr:putative ECF subfamily RNA polymerase sigma-24 factor [Amycolatopsis decaplanina DSM 44594]